MTTNSGCCGQGGVGGVCLGACTCQWGQQGTREHSPPPQQKALGRRRRGKGREPEAGVRVGALPSACPRHPLLPHLSHLWARSSQPEEPPDKCSWLKGVRLVGVRMKGPRA